MPVDDHEDVRALASEIIVMSGADQQIRQSGAWDASLDVKQAWRMKEIVAEIGWPAISKVGATHLTAGVAPWAAR